MTNSNQEHEAIRAEYKKRYDAVLTPLAEELRAFLARCLEGQPRIDRISARPKGVDNFVTKATGGALSYGRPALRKPVH